MFQFQAVSACVILYWVSTESTGYIGIILEQSASNRGIKTFNVSGVFELRIPLINYIGIRPPLHGRVGATGGGILK